MSPRIVLGLEENPDEFNLFNMCCTAIVLPTPEVPLNLKFNFFLI